MVHVSRLFLVCGALSVVLTPLLATQEGNSLGVVHVANEAAEPFSDSSAEELQSLLNWGIEHSDPQALKEMAQAAASDPQVLAGKKARVRELLDAFKSQPTEAQQMQQCLQVVGNLTADTQVRANALYFLQELVQPVDNANNLEGMGAFPILKEALHRSHEEQGAALAVIGTAAANNVPFQKAILAHEGDIVQDLTDILVSSLGSRETRVTAASGALYALSAMLRNLPEAAAAFSEALCFAPPLPSPLESDIPKCPQILLDVVDLYVPDPLQDAPEVPQLDRYGKPHPEAVMLAVGQRDKPLVRKALTLLTDLVNRDEKLRGSLASSPHAAETWIDLCTKLGVEDSEFVEKSTELAVLILDSWEGGIHTGASGSWVGAIPCLKTLDQVFTKASEADEGYQETVVLIRKAAATIERALEGHDEL